MILAFGGLVTAISSLAFQGLATAVSSLAFEGFAAATDSNTPETGIILSMSGQAWLFLGAVVVGGLVGVFYDVFRILRRTAPFLRGTFIVGFTDLIFWLTSTIGVFYFFLNSSYGEIRLFSMLGAVLGGVIYFATVSRFVLIVFVHVIEYMKKVITVALRILFTPLRIIFGWLGRPLAALWKKIRSGLFGVARYSKIKARKTSRNFFILRKKV